MNEEIRERLLEAAKNYTVEQLQLFIDETGWEDWMDAYTDAEDGEPITERENENIDKILTKIFYEAHKEEMI